MQSDFDGTLKRVAAVGYKEIEFAGLFGHPAAARAQSFLISWDFPRRRCMYRSRP